MAYASQSWTKDLIADTLIAAKENGLLGSGGESAPIGTIISFMGNSAPGGYVICDGTVYNISRYPELAKFFKNEFGSINKFGGDGTTTFAVPDLRGEFLRGTGTNSHTNSGNGASVGTHQDATHFPNIGFSKGTSTGLYVANLNTSVTSTGIYNGDSSTSAMSSIGGWVTGSTYSNTSPTFLSARPTNTSVLYCIKAEHVLTEVNAMTYENYSQDEICVGKWIDGKPLYRRTFIGTTVTAGKANLKLGTISNYDTGYITNGYYINQHTDFGWSGASYMLTNTGRDVNTTSYTSYCLISSIGEVIIVFGSTTASSKQVITVEYTKKTDEPNSFSPDMIIAGVADGSALDSEVEEVFKW